MSDFDPKTWKPMSPTLNPHLQFGTECTILMWSDRKPATLLWVASNEKRVMIQEDSFERTDSNGQSEDQHYTYSRNPNGRVREFSWRSNGTWVEVGGTDRLVLGVRGCFYDPHF